MNETQTTRKDVSRRSFLQGSSVAVAGAGAGAVLPAPQVHGGSDKTFQGIKIGLIGCGGRGTGALMDVIGAATKSIYPAEGYHTEDVVEGAVVERKDIQVLALADLFPDRLARCKRNLDRLGIRVPEQQCFTGFDGYEKLLDLSEINYVILATPPHFRPAHLMASIEAGKNVFMEKPAAVDVPGVKQVLQAGKLAEKKGLGIAAGTQRRHQPSYRETIKRIHEGAIGDVVYAKCYWNSGGIWVINRQPEWSDMEWQLRNWNYFTWLGGDHIVEQHVHNLDVMNWVLGTHPIKAVSGLGGRQVRVGERYGHIFDHFAVEYEYPNGVTVFSQCRQINGCTNTVGEVVVGSQGTSNCKNTVDPTSGSGWKYRERDPSAYRLEHNNLIASILAGNPINEAQSIAESTMTAILGREATYSGRELTWEDAMASDSRLGPDVYAFGPQPISPVALPGKYRFS